MVSLKMQASLLSVVKGPKVIRFPCSEGCGSHLGQTCLHGTLAGFPLAIQNMVVNFKGRAHSFVSSHCGSLGNSADHHLSLSPTLQGNHDAMTRPCSWALACLFKGLRAVTPETACELDSEDPEMGLQL